jgi:hypothetical protein
MIQRLACCAISLFVALASPIAVSAQTCTVPNTLTNGQVADATEVMENFEAVAACVDQARTDGITHEGSPNSGELAVFDSSTGLTGGNLSGDVTTSGTTETTLTDTGVVPGIYSNATLEVDAKGRVLAAQNGAAGSGGSGLVLISQVTSDGSASSVTFDTIPQIYQDLVLIVSGQSDDPIQDLVAYANGDTNNGNYRNFTWNRWGTGSKSAPRIGTFPGLGRAGALSAAHFNVEFFAYTSTVWAKHAKSETQFEDATNFFRNELDWKWNDAAPITQLTLQIGSGNLSNGTVFSLYGRGSN